MFALRGRVFFRNGDLFGVEGGPTGPAFVDSEWRSCVEECPPRVLLARTYVCSASVFPKFQPRWTKPPEFFGPFSVSTKLLRSGPTVRSPDDR